MHNSPTLFRNAANLTSVAVWLMCAVATSAVPPANDAATDPAAAAQEFITLLQQGKAVDAAKSFDATMQKALPAEQLKAAWEANVAAHGNFQKLEPGRVARVEKWTVVDTPCVFEKATVVVRLSFNEQHQIGGLFFVATKQRAVEADEGSEIEVKTAAGMLSGTLDLPAGDGPWPVALVIAGSGPTDRDGNQTFMKNDSLKLLGKELAARGVAVLRYDKRGVGKSASGVVDEDKLRFEDFVDDAVTWIRKLRDDQRFNKVVIVGHSEGSLLGILAAQRAPIDAFVSISGSGRDLAALLRNQLRDKLPPELLDKSNHIIDELQAGKKVDDVPAELTTLFRPSVQPYLISWLKYDPAKEIAQLKIPILVVQGTTDLQVSIEDAKLLASGNTNARLVTFENMNHVLKTSPATTVAGQAAAYSDPTVPLAPGLVAEIVSFVKPR